MVVTSGQEGCAQPGAPRAAGSAAGHARGRGERHKQIGVQLRGGELARRRRARRGGRAAPGRVGRATRARKSPAQEGRPPKWLSLKTRLAVLVLVSCFNRHHPSAWKNILLGTAGTSVLQRFPGRVVKHRAIPGSSPRFRPIVVWANPAALRRAAVSRNRDLWNLCVAPPVPSLPTE